MHGKLLEEMRALEARVGREPEADERIHAMIRAYVETAQRSPGVYRFVTRPSDGLNHFLSSVSRLVSWWRRSASLTRRPVPPMSM